MHYSFTEDHAVILEVKVPVVVFNCVLVHIMEQSQSTEIQFLLDEIELDNVSRRKLSTLQLLQGIQSHVLLFRANMKQVLKKTHLLCFQQQLFGSTNLFLLGCIIY